MNFEEFSKKVTTEGSVPNPCKGPFIKPEKPRPLRYVEIPKAINTAEAALWDNPYHRYIDDNPDGKHSAFLDLKWRVSYLFVLLSAVRNREAWTINGGDALVIIRSAPNSRSRIRKTIDSIVGKLTTAILRGFLSLSTKEQQDRTHEIAQKMRAARRDTIADRVDDMMLLNMIATAPEKQGRGFATALANLVTEKADADGRAVYLTSTNLVNKAFYERLGFHTIAEVTAGEDKPTWTQPPVVMQLMVRYT